MLPKNAFKKLEEFLKKNEVPWLEQPKAPQAVAAKPPTPTSSMVIRPLTGWIVRKPDDAPDSNASNDNASDEAALKESLKKMPLRPLGGYMLHANDSYETPLETALKNKQNFKKYLEDAIGILDKRNHTKHKKSDIYKSVCMSKQTFSKICISTNVKKDTIIMLAFALKATLPEAEGLLKHAGYSLGDCIQRDVIFKYCFEERIFDIDNINELLEKHKEKLLLLSKKKMKLTLLE